MDLISALLAIAAFVAPNNNACLNEEKPQIVDNLADLQLAINNANENVQTTILVKSFSMSNQTIKDAMRNLNVCGKDIVIKGAESGTTITSLDQGSLYIVGQNAKTSSIAFEGITFEQAIDASKTITLPNNAISLSKTSYSTNLKVKDCHFKNFTGSVSSGGAIQMALSGAPDYQFKVNVENCSFSNCYSKISGGAISIDGADNASINIKSSAFSSCSSPLGGAISLKNVKASIANTVFKQNGDSKGGALFLSQCDSLISNNSFFDNVSTSIDGNSIYVEDSKFHNNLFINNSFSNQVSDFKEFYFDTSIGSLAEIKSKLYLNTFVCGKDIDISYDSYSEHYEEFANLYISAFYAKDTTSEVHSVYSPNIDLVRLVEGKHYLPNNESLKLDAGIVADKIKTFYLEAFGDFYVGDNLSDTVQIHYDGRTIEVPSGEKAELNSFRFGFDLVENKVGDVAFSFENSLISSLAPLNVYPVHRLNATGAAVYIGGPSFVLVSALLVTLLILLKKKRAKEKKANPNTFDIDAWAKQAVNDEMFSSITSKEKDVLYLILKDMPRKEIAAALFISESTVKNHTTKIFSKLNIKNRSELLAMLNKK